MSHTRAALPVIEIDSPCPADWDAMTGDARERFCAHCNRHVHDLSVMSSGEVADLICRNAGDLCVRFDRAADGQIKTLDYAPPPPKGRVGERIAEGALCVGIVAVAAAIVMPAMQPMGRMRIVRPAPPAPVPAAAVGAVTPTSGAPTGEVRCPTP